MKIVRWKDMHGKPMCGKWVDDAHALPIRGELFGDHTLSETPVPIGRRLAPVDPPNIIAIGRNYADHAKEMKAESPPEEPLIFLKATSSVVGPEDSIILPRSAPDEVDFEAELAVVIGRIAKNVTEREALSFVFGYTCANDVSARDCQKRRDKQWARGKSFDTFCPLGPHIVTADELSPNNLAVRSYLNGKLMQDGNTGDMIFSVAQLVSYVSHQFTLLPGTVILTGTPAGVGSARNPPVFLGSGDEFSVEIEGIGRLGNRVVADR
ncbi:MAG: fumarylacetoacetate hydrolase family protein [Planctomycetes bacterium]|nr:fumarylacetoacetate hydrolase family protein [Planctomycetota bacterium]